MVSACVTHMDLERPIFTNADIIIAAAGIHATLQAWANRGTLRLPDPQRNRGLGKKRLYSTLDVAGLVAIKTLTGFGLSATAATQIVQRLKNEPETALTWRRALVRTVQHLYILVFEGETRPLLCAGGAAMTSVLEGLNNSAGAAVFDVGPPIVRAMEAFGGRKSAEGSVVPGLEDVRSEAPLHHAGARPTAPPRPPIPGEYPKYKYRKGRKTIVKDAEAKQLWAMLGKIFRSDSLAGWQHDRALFHPPPATKSCTRQSTEPADLRDSPIGFTEPGVSILGLCGPRAAGSLGLRLW